MIHATERALAEDIAHRLAEKLWLDLADTPDQKQVHNMGQSNYEIACKALNLVGVYRQLDHYTNHSVLVPAAQVPAHMKALKNVSQDAFDALVSAFVANFLSHEMIFPTERTPFDTHPTLAGTAHLLAGCGYLAEENGRFQWTDKIAPLMHHWLVWSD
jgi:hypothetical protein